MKTYLVGGAVRDELLNLEVGDRDWVVVGATADALLDLGYQGVGKDFPVFLHPETHEEYALARTERKQGHGYHGFVCNADPTVTLEQDLLRRDLTINAMAQDDQGTIIDPYGGQQDLQKRLLRHVSEAFAEDPLRVLRTARFAARFAHLGFSIAEETLGLMGVIVAADELQFLARERVWVEWDKALGEQSPGAFIETLAQCNALTQLLGDLQLDQVALNNACKLSPSSSVRFAALLSKLTAEQVMQACEALKAPRYHRELATISARHGNSQWSDAEGLLQILEDCDALRRPDRFAEFLLVRLACDQDTQLLQRALPLIDEVATAPLLEQGYRGPELGAALRQQRLEELQKLLAAG